MGGVTPEILDIVRQQPNIAAAERAGAFGARVKLANGEWLPLRLFVTPDDAPSRINTVHSEAGDSAAGTGSVLIERSATELLGTGVGRTLTIEIAGVGVRTLRVSGIVHDPGVAPAWQEQTGYAYVRSATLAALGVSRSLDLLKIVVRDGASDADAIARTVRELSQVLAGRGVTVLEARIPPPGRHPHQSQMNAVITMLLAFSLLVMVLGATLTAGVFSALLTIQAPQIAIMKTIGARERQIVGLYLALVSALGAVATIGGLVMGLTAGRNLIGLVATLLNLRLEQSAPPWWVVMVGVFLGLVTPLLAALVPILRAARRTVREAIDDRGGAAPLLASNRLVRLLTGIRFRDAAVTIAIRNSVRRRARLLTTAAMLALAGAMFIASLDLKSAWERNVAEARQDRHFEFEMRLVGGYPAADVLTAIRSVPGVAIAESWAATSATRGGATDLEISRIYPDGGHGGVTLRAASPTTTLIAHRMLAGRWLSADDSNAVVLNSLAAGSVFSDLRVGDTVTLRIDHRPIQVRVAGLMREPLTSATVFVTPGWFGTVTGHADTTSIVRVQVRDAAGSARVARDVQRALERAGMGVRVVITEQRLARAQGGHVYILVYALGFIATLMAIVGLIGLASSLGVSVLERTREFGIMRALGGTRAMIMRIVIIEGVTIAGLSVGVALIASRAISTIVGRVLASIASQELVLRLSISGSLLWITGLALGTLLVSVLPAARAARLTARDALAHI